MKDHANRTNIFGRARMLFMALLMVLTMTATAMSGTDAYAANDTVYVATYDQLRVALEDTPGVKEVVVDPQAAVEEGEVVYGVEDDENSDAFYIGFDGPLTVSHDITITSADDVDVYFARSDSFRRDQGKPALLNIDSTGNLNLDGLITMTGEEVATTFYEADEENPAEFVFSVKSKDGTGEDNEVWNRGQALQGGFYIQNNGGEYTLGDDVIMEDINLADDVEGVEQIHEVEKTTLRSLFSSNKSDEEVVEEEAVEEKAAEEEATQEEEVVVAPTPKKSLKMGLKSSPLKSTPNGANGVWRVDSWKQLKDILNNTNNTVNTIIITQDIVATPAAGETDKSAYLRGRTVTIKGPDSGDVHIYRDPTDADFPLFVVQNNNNTLNLGSNLILSGKTMACAKTLDDFASNKLPGKAEPEEHSAGASKAKFACGTRKLALSSLLGNMVGVSTSREAVEVVIDSNGKIKVSDQWVHYDFTLKGSDEKQNELFEVRNLDDETVTTVENGESYVLYNPTVGYICPAGDQSGTTSNISEAYEFTATAIGSSGGTYWTVPGQTTPQYTSKTDANLVAAMKTYNDTNTVSGWIINGENYYTEPEAATALKAYNKKIGLPEQGCDSAKPETYTSDNFTGGTTINEPKAFFVKVDKGGTLNIQGAILEDFVTDGSVKNAAPITVTGKYSDEKKSTLNMSSGAIQKNTVGYGAVEDDFQNNIQDLGTKIRDTDPTNTAGAVIFADEAVGNFTGSAKILSNRADAGALIITSNANVTMKESTKTDNKYNLEFSKNIGWHHSGAVLVEDGGTFTLEDGSINNNVAWFKGGAVWATEYGTNGLVRWQKYPTSMKPEVTKHDEGGNFVMNGGELDSNFANARAGAVEVESDGVTLTKGVIKNNKCKSLGGAIYIEGDSPIYSYTLNINKGYIVGNKAKPAEPYQPLDQKLVKGVLTDGDQYATNTVGGIHRDGDWADWGAKHSGDGGGVWLCAMGGTSVFTSTIEDDETHKIVIAENEAYHEGETAQNNGWGDDFYVSHRHGSALVQNLLGVWKGDDNNKVDTIGQNGKIIKGPKGMYNTTSAADLGKPDDCIEIIGNVARNGGGIACNGTVILGEASNVYRYEAEFDITKGWDGIPLSEQKDVTLKLYYEYDANDDGNISDDEVYPLYHEVDEERVQYEVTLGTEGNLPKLDGNEVIYKTDKDTAKAFVPATVKHEKADGTFIDVPLYKIRNKVKGENTKIYADGDDYIDINNSAAVRALFDHINNKGSEDVELEIEWNIVIKEDGNEFNTSLGEGTATATNKLANSERLIDPVTGEVIQKGSFSVYFSTVTFGQTLTNSPKDITINKVGLNDEPLSGGTFKIFKAKDANHGGARNDYIIDTAHDPQTLTAVDGELTFQAMGGTAGKYLLFEEAAPDNYVTPKDPWLIDVDANGNAKIYKNTEEPGKCWIAGFNKVQNFVAPTGADGYTKEYLTSPLKKWPMPWFEHANSQVDNISNEKATVELLKADASGNAIKKTAKFTLYGVDRSTRELFDINGNPCVTESKDIGVARKGHDNTNYSIVLDPVIEEATVNSNDGKLSLSNLNTDTVYLLFETEAPEGYKREKAPWLIYVKKDGTYKLYRYKATTYKGQNPKNNNLSIDNPSDTGWTNLESHLVDRWWPTGVNGANFEEVTSANGGLKKLINNSLTIEFEKVSKENTTLKLTTAKFDLYHAVSTNDPETTGYKYKIDPNKPNRINSQDNITIKNGKYTLPITQSGMYLLFETEAPAGYVKPVAPWGIWVDADGGVRAYKIKDTEFETYQTRYETTTDLKTIEIECTAYEQFTGATIDNRRKPIELTKAKGIVDSVTGEVRYGDTKTTIEGAVFKVYKATEDQGSGSGKKYYRGDPIDGEYESDSNGIIKLPSSISTSGPSTSGTDANGNAVYWIEEITPARGYEKSSIPWVIWVKNGKLKEVYRFTKYAGNQELLKEDVRRVYSDSNDYGAQGTAYIHNEPIKIYKTATDEDVFLPDAKFKAFGVEERQQNYVTNSNKFLGNLESKERGIIDISEIVKNNIGTANTLKFLVFEDEAPSGYKLVSTPWLITVTKNGEVTVTQYSKVTAGEKAYPTTTSNTFWNKSLFTVDKPKKNLVNISEPLEFKKVDSSTKIGIKGVEFELYYINYDESSDTYSKDTQLGGKLYSDANGTVRITNLPYRGDFQFLLFETEAAKGYIKDVTPWYVQIKYGYNKNTEKTEMYIEYIQDMKEDAKGNYSIDSTSWSRTDFCEPTSAQLENTKAYDLPSAGGMGTYWFMVIGAMMMGFALTAGFTKMNLFKLLRR